MLIDTHAHLFATEFKEDIDEVIKRMKQANIQKVFMPNIDVASIEAMHNLHQQEPNMLYPLLGLHPCAVKQDFKNELSTIEKIIQEHSPWGIGESGLDLYWDKSTLEHQISALEVQIQWAIDLKLPIILHTREATAETLAIIKKHQKGALSGIFHCFSGSLEEYHQIKDLGFKVGIGGVVTFKNSGLDRVVEQMDMEDIVLETDAPYLAPTPKRGKRNEPLFLNYIAQKVADIKLLNLETVIDKTTENARKIFNIE